MPDGDLASIVLAAARKERAKQDAGQGSAFNDAGNGHAIPNGDHGHDDDVKKGSKGKARENGDVLTSHQDSGSNSNGLLEAPPYNRAMTASPEPLTPRASHDGFDDNVDGQPQEHDRAQQMQTQPNRSIHKTAAAATPDAGESSDKGRAKDHFKAPPPVKNRPAVRAGPSARKLSSAFFGGGSGSGSGGHGSSANTNKQQAADRKSVV